MAKKNKMGCGLGCLGILFNLTLGLTIIGIGLGLLSSSKLDLEFLKNAIEFVAPDISYSDLKTNFDEKVAGFSDDLKSETAEVQTAYQPLVFSGNKQIVLGELDYLGRATSAHIQLRYSDKPTSDREPKITYDPVGWHNYKYKADVKGTGELTEEWLMNRGHLVGYLFSGLNSEGRNLVPITRYLNAGTMDDKATDRSNYNSMLFYEMGLNDWLKANPDYFLDLYVKPNYAGDELLPRSISMYWTGISPTGEQVAIELSNFGLSRSEGVSSFVELPNTSPNAEINYLDGTAKPL